MIVNGYLAAVDPVGTVDSVDAGTEDEESGEGCEVRARRRVGDGGDADRLQGRDPEGADVLRQGDPLEVRVELEGQGPILPVQGVRARPDAHR